MAKSMAFIFPSQLALPADFKGIPAGQVMQEKTGVGVKVAVGVGIGVFEGAKVGVKVGHRNVVVG